MSAQEKLIKVLSLILRLKTTAQDILLNVQALNKTLSTPLDRRTRAMIADQRQQAISERGEVLTMLNELEQEANGLRMVLTRIGTVQTFTVNKNKDLYSRKAA